jgi:hypothetical protein
VRRRLQALNKNIKAASLAELKSEGIRRDLFRDAISDLNELETIQLRCLFTWMVFSRHSLSLGAAKQILQVTSKSADFGGRLKVNANEITIERELDGRLSQYVKV